MMTKAGVNSAGVTVNGGEASKEANDTEAMEVIESDTRSAAQKRKNEDAGAVKLAKSVANSDGEVRDENTQQVTDDEGEFSEPVGRDGRVQRDKRSRKDAAEKAASWSEEVEREEMREAAKDGGSPPQQADRRSAAGRPPERQSQRSWAVIFSAKNGNSELKLAQQVKLTHVRKAVQPVMPLTDLLEVKQLPKGDVVAIVKEEKHRAALLQISEIEKIAVKCELPRGETRSQQQPRGVIHGVPIGCTGTWIYEELAELGVTNAVKYGPTTAVLTFEEGSELPTEVWLEQRHEVYEYVTKPLLCWRCGRPYHGRMTCKRAPRCRNCGGENHLQADCTRPTKCGNCKGTHRMNDKNCPVIRDMNKVAERAHADKISIVDARRRVEDERKQAELAEKGPPVLSIQGKTGAVRELREGD